MFYTLVSQISAIGMVVVCGLAVLIGDRTARTVGVAAALVWLGSAVSEQYATKGAPLHAVIMLDVVFLMILGGATYLSHRTWPAFCLVAHAVGLAVHVSFAFEVEVSVWLYYTALTGSAWGVLASIGYGTWQAWRERTVESLSAAASPRSA